MKEGSYVKHVKKAYSQSKSVNGAWPLVSRMNELWWKVHVNGLLLQNHWESIGRKGKQLICPSYISKDYDVWILSREQTRYWPVAFFRSMYYMHTLLNAATDKQSSKVVVNGLLALAFWRSFLPDKRTFSILGSDNIHCTETWLNKTLSSIPSFVKGLPSKPERWAFYLELQECLKVTHLKKELLTVMSLSSFCC